MRILFPGDPEYDQSNPTRDWHYAILFAAMAVVFFTVATQSPILIAAAFTTFLVAFFTAPDDPRYP